MVKAYDTETRLQRQISNAENRLSSYNFNQVDRMRMEMLASSKQKPHRVANILTQFNQLAPFIDFRLDEASRDDLIELVKKINEGRPSEEEDPSIWTITEYKKALKAYYVWLTGEDHPDIVDFMRVHPKESEKPRVQKEELLDVHMVEKMINAASNPRDKVFLAVLWDSGARLSEILTLRWKDIVFQDDIVKCHIWNGKNRPRKILLVESVPMLRHWKNWKEKHNELKPEMPVFTNYRPYDSREMCSARNIAKQINDIRSRVDIPERIRTNPHAWRKARATNYAERGMTQPNMTLQFGWAPGSDASKYYISLALQDLERQIREIYPGLDDLDDEEPDFIGRNIPEYTREQVQSFAAVV